jgi:homoserine O-acetyltransferase
MWATKYPGLMDAVVPMACLPTAMSGRNWLLRRMLTDAIRSDPEWMGGNYSAQPKNMQKHLLYYSLATNGGNMSLFSRAPDYAKADDIIAKALSQPFRGDANDTLYQWESSADYNASANLDRIQAMVVAINSADDERNPPELGVMEREIKRVKNGRYVLLPLSADTRGHGTTGNAKLWKQHLVELLQQAPRK